MKELGRMFQRNFDEVTLIIFDLIRFDIEYPVLQKFYPPPAALSNDKFSIEIHG